MPKTIATPEAASSIAVGEDHEPPKSTTVYYDTADLRLYRWGAVLCRQKGGTDAGWHLALPVGEDPPTTVSLPLAAGRPGKVPPAMADLVTALRRDEPLQPITTLHTRLGPAELLSDAFGTMASAPPDIPLRDPPGADDPATEAVRANLAEYARRFLLQDVAVRQGLPEGVHDLRVAARHLRSTLKTFRPLVDKQWADGLRDELRWAATQLGPVRDTEVLLRRLAKHAGALQPPYAGLAVSAIEEHYPAALDHARAELLVALRSRRQLELLDRLVAAVADPPFTDEAQRPCGTALPPLVQRAWKVLDKSVRRLQPTSAPEAWHDTRKKAKRARYATDLVKPTLPDAKPLAKAARQITDILGDLHDAHVAQQALFDLAATVDGPAGFALGKLACDQQARATALQAKFWAAWPDTRAAYRKSRG